MLSGRRRDAAGGARAALSAPTTALAVSIALAIAGSGGRARAACEDAMLAVGVTVQRCEDPGRRWSVLRADLAAADVAVRVSQSSERGLSADAWMERVPGTIAAVQGGPFRFPGWDPAGLTIGEGEAWPGTIDDGALGVLALDTSGAGLIAPAEVSVPVQAWMHSAVSGVIVLRAGSARSECEGNGCERAPRTAAGLSRDGRTLLLIVVEGWTAASEGVSDPELGVLALEAGAYDALRIGDGATSLLATADGQGAIASSDGAPRPTAAFLGIADRGSGASGDLVGVIERASDTMPLLAAQIRVETTDGRTISMGGTLTDGAYFRFTLPERTYVVRATLDGYRDACRVCTVERGRETWCSIFLESGSGTAECSAPPRGVDAGTFPSADGGARDAGAADAGDAGEQPRIDGGCAVRGRGDASGGDASGGDARSSAVALGVAALALIARRRRR